MSTRLEAEAMYPNMDQEEREEWHYRYWERVGMMTDRKVLPKYGPGPGPTLVQMMTAKEEADAWVTEHRKKKAEARTERVAAVTEVMNERKDYDLI